MAMTFNDALSRFRSLIMRRATENGGTVSAVDISENIPSVSGPRRGAIVRRAFESLVSDKSLRRTRGTVYNTSTHHNVAVYRVR